MKLVIVESPTKCHTIQKYLGDEYVVLASLGHIRDLSITGKGGLGVDIEHEFKPTYVNSKGKENVIKELVKNAKKADEVILATDPDREGEAISWHLAEVLKLPIDKTKRLEFHEITKPAVQKALQNPRLIDMSLVQSQETRRIIDRIMGFQMSSLLKRRIGSLSAGRVQSVTLKLITDREKEIQAFVPREYYTIHGVFKDDVKATLDSLNFVKIDQIKTSEEADKILNDISKDFEVYEVTIRNRRTEAKPAFTTSTLQQEANVRYKFSTKKTASVAQKLYEGIDIGNETRGLITYMRTDSVRLSPEFIDNAREFILKNYGEEYLGSTDTKKSKGLIQDAHEAIRPTSLDLEPKKIKQYLTDDQYKLYSLIYKRAIASLMAPKLDEVTIVKFVSTNGYIFKTDGVRALFDGFSKIYEVEEESKSLSQSFKKGDKLTISSLRKEQHFTQGPSRFTEAKIVKSMEELGIGRPSTYASTIAILYERKYIVSEKGTIIPTEQGIETVDKLNEFFKPFMDVTYTARMEQNLDNIVEGNDSRLGLLNSFYNEFEKYYEAAVKGMEKKAPVQTGEMCPTCGAPLVIKKSKYGEFVACSNYPECNYVKPKEKKEVEILEDQLCPKCGKPLVKRTSKKGDFYACSGYPSCRYILGNEEKKEDEVSDRLCPKCGKPLLIKKGKRGHGDFYACSGFPKCRFIESLNPKEKMEK